VVIKIIFQTRGFSKKEIVFFKFILDSLPASWLEIYSELSWHWRFFFQGLVIYWLQLIGALNLFESSCFETPTQSFLYIVALSAQP